MQTVSTISSENHINNNYLTPKDNTMSVVIKEDLLEVGDKWTNNAGTWICTGVNDVGDPDYEKVKEMNPQEAIFAFVGWLELDF